MILVRRNSKEFKAVEKLLKQYYKQKERKKLIRLYSLKPGINPEDKILLNDLKENSDILFNISYEGILAFLNDPSRKLYRENGNTVYYFKSSSGDNAYEFPFEFTGKLKKMLT